MSAPCFEDQTRDKLKVAPAIAKAFLNEAMDHLSNGKDYADTLQSMSEKSGLKPETINSILKRDPKAFSVTKQALATASKARQIRDAADAFADQLKTNGKIYQEGALSKAWDLNRRAALFGHSTVFPWTHMRNWALQIPTAAGRARMAAFWRAATDTFRYKGEKGQAQYEMDMSLMKLGDRYDFWRSMGADITPGKRTPGDIMLQSRKPSWGTRNFDTLKIARYQHLEHIWQNVDPALKEGDTGKDLASMIVRDLNYSTGSVMEPKEAAKNSLSGFAAALSKYSGKALLSSKLFVGKHLDAYLQPLQYLSKAGRMTSAERAAANIALGRWGNIVATHLAILGANYGFNKAMGFRTPNLTNVNSPSDFLRIRAGNVIVPFSPMLEAIRLPILMTAALIKKGPSEAGKVGFDSLWSAAHPTLHLAAEQVTGKDYLGRPVPSLRTAAHRVAPSVIPPVKSPRSRPPETGLEYASTRFTPIAVSGALHEFYQELRTNGASGSLAMAIVKSAFFGAASGLAGQHMFEQEGGTGAKPRRQKSIEQPMKWY
jgi:hypothetical protein